MSRQCSYQDIEFDGSQASSLIQNLDERVCEENESLENESIYHSALEL